MGEWQDSLCIGISEIDIQHKMLFDNFKSFLAACDERQERDGIYRLFWFLEVYALAHFQDEEALMMQVGFPDFEKHRDQHRAFSAEVARLKERLRGEGPTPGLVSTITTFIGGWLVKHVSTMDKAIGNFMAAAGIAPSY